MGKTVAVATSIGIFLYDSGTLEVQRYFAEDNYILSLAILSRWADVSFWVKR
jgi:hypothetical protein